MGIRTLFVLVCVTGSTLSFVTATLVWVFFLGAAWTWHALVPLVGAEICCLVVLMVVSLRFAQSLRRRLYAIEEAAALMAGGRLQHRVQTMGDTDEIGRLTEQFNRMGEQLEQQVRILQQLADQNQALAAEADQAAALRERQMLARELHDSVSQQLFALAMLASTAQRQYQMTSSRLAQTLLQVETLAAAAQREMRALLLHLRPIELQGRNFDEAVRSFLAAVEERHQLQCRYQSNLVQALSPSIEEQLFRILQEAVANVLKHAEATEVLVEMSTDGQLLTLAVLDNGKGMPAVKSDGVQDSYGLRAMEERAVSLGGRLELWQRTKGTAVEVHIPLVERGAKKG